VRSVLLSRRVLGAESASVPPPRSAYLTCQVPRSAPPNLRLYALLLPCSKKSHSELASCAISAPLPITSYLGSAHPYPGSWQLSCLEIHSFLRVLVSNFSLVASKIFQMFPNPRRFGRLIRKIWRYRPWEPLLLGKPPTWQASGEEGIKRDGFWPRRGRVTRTTVSPVRES
jgi:hypothetical protein